MERRKVCHCTLPYTDKDACAKCSATGSTYLLPIDLDKYQIWIEDERYIIEPKK